VANYNIKSSNILYHWQLLMASFRFCQTHLLHIKPLVVNKSAISPFLGGYIIWEIIQCGSTTFGVYVYYPMYICVLHDIYMCITQYIYMCITRCIYVCITRYIYVYYTIYICVLHNIHMCITRCIYVYYTIYICVLHDVYMCITQYIYVGYTVHTLLYMTYQDFT